jgi:predicted dehydrogenase
MMVAVPQTEELCRAGLAVVGAGYWGPNLLRNAQHTPEFDVRYLCDLDVERARRVVGDYSTVQVTDALQRVLDDPTVHAVAVATPASTHADVVNAALDAGKHVLVEKPLAASLSDGAALVRTAAQRGLTLMLDHTYCYTPAVSRLRELLQAGEIGELQYFDSVRINLGLVQPDVDVLWDLAPHDIAILDTLHPRDAQPVAVAAHGADPLGIGRASVGYLSVRLANGGIAHVHVNWLSPTKIRTVIVGGSRRTAVWNDVDPQQRVAIYDRGIDVAAMGLDADPSAVQTLYRTGDMVAPALSEKEALRSVMEAFAAAVLYGKPVLTDGRSGLRVLAILEAARVSMHEGGAFVPLDMNIDPLLPRPA